MTFAWLKGKAAVAAIYVLGGLVWAQTAVDRWRGRDVAAIPRIDGVLGVAAIPKLGIVRRLVLLLIDRFLRPAAERIPYQQRPGVVNSLLSQARVHGMREGWR